MNTATQAQNKAARPRVSTWLTANAGSGKTRVLTDRVARLLLSGVRPESILCLTYTTAAASEMQNRLFDTLGSWSMQADHTLRDALTSIGEVDPKELARARTLFAEAIEAPGGLKIQTIHSFCSKVLRQFPLEAGVNPNFRELDEAGQTALIETVVEDISRDQSDVLKDMYSVYSSSDFVPLAKTIAAKREAFAPHLGPEKIYDGFGVKFDVTQGSFAREVISTSDLEFLRSLAPLLRELGSKKDQDLAQALAGLPANTGKEALLSLEACLLKKSEPFNLKQIPPTKAVKEAAAFAPLLAQYSDIGARVECARDQRLRISNAEQTVALQNFAQCFLERYQIAKAKTGSLDFDDLIIKTRNLLNDKGLAWVHYRLDARIDHILVDEAQDTSPAQWDIINALCSEIVAGDAERSRTLFVVGDKKQSIYSFQGADAEGFDAREASFREQLEHGLGLAEGKLLHSFRSSPAILNVVDAVFSEAGEGVHSAKHRAFHEAMPGRVDLWPLVPAPGKLPELDWYDTSDRDVTNDATLQLAQSLARTVKTLTEIGTIPGNNGEWRRVQARDIMILVQRRSALFDKIISACKTLELPIAGADRLKLGSELVVRDLLALLAFLALPEDDLSLASALRSPILGWSEAELYELAAKRKEGAFLWQELRRRHDDFPRTFDALTELRSRVDYQRPYEIIHSILTEFGGRRNFLSRLGPEAEDGMDELMNQALLFETAAVPTLTGFVAAAQAKDTEIKREAESGGDLLRVMTVHGAKGLESPIVILPDTTFMPTNTRQVLVPGPNGVLSLSQGRNQASKQMEDAKTTLNIAANAERERLLYVAMTRAEKWLIVAGVQPKRDSGQRLNWHEKISNALDKMEAVELETPLGAGKRYSFGNWSDQVDSRTEAKKTSGNTDVRVGFSAPNPSRAPKPRSPSDLGGETVLAAETQSPSGGTRKGRQMHLLLEHLPRASDPMSKAADLLSHGPDAVLRNELPDLVEEAQSIIHSHRSIFADATLAEVDIVGFSPTLNERISGTIDRLIVDETSVRAIDFKTNANVPQREEDTPESILRQMGAYLEVLEDIYPEKDIEVAVLWTTTGQIMSLKHVIVRDALRRATTS